MFGVVFLFMGLVLLVRARYADLNHTVIPDRIRPAYLTPFQGYVLGTVFCGFGAVAVISPIVQRYMKK
jgi:hypothetical protein